MLLAGSGPDLRDLTGKVVSWMIVLDDRHKSNWFINRRECLNSVFRNSLNMSNFNIFQTCFDDD